MKRVATSSNVGRKWPSELTTYPCWYDAGHRIKALAWHRGSFHTQWLHVHPCFSAGGKQIVYTADPQGYGQVFAVDISDWKALPDHNSLTR